MKKVDFNFQIKDGKNKVIDNRTGAEILAFYLNQAILKEEAMIVKFHGWAVKLSRHEVLELDDGDIVILKEFILKHDQIFVITKQPILVALNNTLKKE